MSKTSPALSSTKRIWTDGADSSSLLIGSRDGEREFRAPALIGSDPDAAPQAFDDFFADGETETSTFVIVSSVQAFEEPKDLLGIFARDADAVILDREQPESIFGLGRDMDSGRIFTPILDGISDKVLKQLMELDGMNADRGKLGMTHLGPACRKI